MSYECGVAALEGGRVGAEFGEGLQGRVGL